MPDPAVLRFVLPDDPAAGFPRHRRKRVKWDGQSFAGQLEVTFPGGPDPEKRFGLPIPWLSADPALLFIGVEIGSPRRERTALRSLQKRGGIQTVRRQNGGQQKARRAPEPAGFRPAAPQDPVPPLLRQRPYERRRIKRIRHLVYIREIDGDHESMMSPFSTCVRMISSVTRYRSSELSAVFDCRPRIWVRFTPCSRQSPPSLLWLSRRG